MQEIQGNIWDHHGCDAIVITTNYGWKRDGTNVMGAGIAKEAAEIYPDLPAIYGDYCKRYYEETSEQLIPAFYHDEYNLFLLASKKLHTTNPSMSWSKNSDMEQIRFSVGTLREYCNIVNWNPLKQIVMPRIGCGNGGLEWEKVKEVIKDYLPPYVSIITL